MIIGLVVRKDKRHVFIVADVETIMVRGAAGGLKIDIHLTTVRVELGDMDGGSLNYSPLNQFVDN